ncbi:MAG: hypothetical protein ACTSXD_03670 [Candidatus Heimdallarchaeaceae archaeon]
MKQPKTKLVKKEYSPLIVRRYSTPLLMFVALITDDNLSDLDRVVNKFLKSKKIENDIQSLRNLAGCLVEHLQRHYKKSEGIAVVIQADKMTISSLSGDFMNHLQCRLELYSLLNFATQV